MGKLVTDDDGNTYDEQTGEIIDKKFKSNVSKGYFQIYTTAPRRFRKLGLAGHDVWWYLAEYINSNQTNIPTNRRTKEIIASDLGCSMSKVERGLAELVDAEILIRIGRGNYEINAKHVWKGGKHQRIDIINNRPIGWKSK